MSLETAQTINQLNPSNPAGSDRLKDGDDHIRLIKSTLKNTFPGITGALDASVTQDFLNGLSGLLVPKGVITLWSGADTAIPTGWAICNGQTVTGSDGVTAVHTPDMRGLVPAGVADGQAVLATFGAPSQTITSDVQGGHGHTVNLQNAGSHDHGAVTGGHSLSIDELAAHAHGSGIGDASTQAMAYGSKAVSTSNQMQQTTAAGTSQAIGETIGKGTAHTHAITAAGDHTHTASAVAVDGHAHMVIVDVRQPSIALFYIIKI